MNPLYQYNVNSLYSRGSSVQNSFLDDWESVKKRIINIYGEVIFRSWFKSVTFSCHDSGTIFLISPSRFIRDWIRTNYLDFILKAWRDIDKKIITIDLIVLEGSSKSNHVKNNIFNISAKEDNHIGKNISILDHRKEEKFLTEEINQDESSDIKQFDLFGLESTNKSNFDSEIEHDKRNNQNKVENKAKKEKIEQVKENHKNLCTAGSFDLLIKPKNDFLYDDVDDKQICFDRRYTFDTFVQGDSNELAYFACKNLAENKRISNLNHNPLFLYGGVGLGKTHLMHAVANYKIQDFKEKYKDNWLRKAQEKIVYLPSEKFMDDFLYALKNKCTKDFKARFKTVDILMIDDVQFFMGKGCTQEEFFHVLNNLINDGKQLIISADRLPGLLTGLDEKIRSRLGWGLVADIKSGGYDLRLGVLKKKSQYLGVRFEENILQYLAENIDNNIRELEGALNKLALIKQLSPNRVIDIDFINERLSDMFKKDIGYSSKGKLIKSIISNNPSAKMISNNQNCSQISYQKDSYQKEYKITLFSIQQKVSNYYNISVNEILSDIKARNVSMPRQVAMYLTKKLTSLSLMEIAKQFGGKNHSTIIHGISKIETSMKNDRALSSDVDNIIKSLKLN